jgi:predicted GIY-YIG superfamily endonuclease
LTGRSSIPETADGGSQLLRLHSCQSHRRNALHRRDQRPHSARGRASPELADSFTKKYEVARLVYFEQFDDAENAIRREKRLKRWNRAWKIRLIEEFNPNWDDLYSGIAGV